MLVCFANLQIGHVGKELFCVKKFIGHLSRLFLSFGEVNISVFLLLCSSQIKCTIYENILKFFIKTLHIIVAPKICFNLMCEICNHLDEFCFYLCLKMIKTEVFTQTE